MSARWGTDILPGARARFRLWAPDHEGMTLEIDGAADVPMARTEGGWFEASAEARPGTRYRFRLPDGLSVPDPASRAQLGGVHGWSIVTDPAAYSWRTGDWTGRPWEETVIQEVHLGTMGGCAGLANKLPELAEIGITAIELMPVAAFSGTRNWGYDGVLPYALAEPYGTPDDLKALIDHAHALGLSMFLDVVYNHFGPDGNYLGTYASDFFDRDADTPWGGAVAVSQEPVRRFFIDNALMWLGEYRFDGLRFDAVHAIADDGFLSAMAAEIREALPGRHVHLVLENEKNDADLLAPDAYDAQWNDDFHNVLHVLLTGEREGYYEGFADDATERLARCLSDGFIYQGETPPGADHARGKPSSHLPATRFVSFLQNHDQIGNRAFGERLTLLTGNERLRAATALLLLAPQIPLIFMGDETGSRSPFLFFTDFHDELAEAVRNGRRREFARFAAFSDPAAREKIPDPNATRTFADSVAAPGPDAGDWLEPYRDLLRLRFEHVVPRLAGACGEGAEVLGDKAVAARWRMDDGAVLSIALNLGDEPVQFPEPVGETVFALGEPGEPAAFRAEIAA
ncbi:malto-oligosyltrehalose trehalohydrolase [Novosphingobium marinum]|uniref:Malto-oligosyltrehalose trehalohydrolase n=1 Tax=Novosphingobium marinum TaxID=1514948 RepID=A0A7Z0BSU0_9SPHN|nr:malto-oligosyltrehalose trehalohydrolase [Novosphingobium marinum]NYH95286.1 maltooligosyltrehalose trehalohydrolase [Novosphingobium marinum]GGC25836.1 malto-oligosyltrehalose trehalohydrolase [Novosphingobium marinum]